MNIQVAEINNSNIIEIINLDKDGNIFVKATATSGAVIGITLYTKTEDLEVLGEMFLSEAKKRKESETKGSK